MVREEPLLIVCHGLELVTMRTPGHDRALVLGFLLGEQAIRSIEDVVHIEELPEAPSQDAPARVVVSLKQAPDRAVSDRLTRTHEVRSSCSLCGLTDPDSLLDGVEALLPGTPRLDRSAIETRRQAFVAEQGLFEATGASHAAALFGPDGSVWGRGEDVGRHNALDKAIGVAALAGHELAQATVMLSGRAGFDLVLKALRVRIPIILSVSAPSAQALDLCRAADATLVGFVREGRSRVYHDVGRLVNPSP